MKLFAKHALSAAATTTGTDNDGTTTTTQSGLGFGCMGISAFYGDTVMGNDQAQQLLKFVYDSGCRHFDTAEAYSTKGETHNEEVLGAFFATVPRDSYSIATKYWPNPDNDKAYTYEDVKTHLLASLKRLNLEYVDLYYAHRVLSIDGGVTFVQTCQRLKEEGLIKEIGLSEVSGKWLTEIIEKAGSGSTAAVDAVQQEWSLLSRTMVEDDLIPVCKQHGIAIVAYSPLARNLLATKVVESPKDWRGSLPRYSTENLKRNNLIVDKINELAKKYGNATSAQLSLAWLFHKASELGVTVVPIPGTTKIDNAKVNIGSVNIQLSNDDCQVLERLSKDVVGERGNERYMSLSIENQN